MTNEMENKLNAYIALADPKKRAEIIQGMSEKEAAFALEDMEALQKELEKEIENTAAEEIENLNFRDNGLAYPNLSPILPAAFKNVSSPQKRPVSLSPTERQDKAMLILHEDYKITPYESEIADTIIKFMEQGQITSNGKYIVFSLRQLYNAIRHGGQKAGISAKQKDNLNADLDKMRRMTSFSMNDAAFEWINADGTIFKATEYEAQLIFFKRFKGEQVNGKDIDYLYCVDIAESPILQLSRRLHMYDGIDEEYKSIKDENGKNINLTKNVINLRAYLSNVILRYDRALQKGSQFSNKINYDDIFAACEIGTHRETRKRAKADIKTILNYWVKIGLISNWGEYSNKGSRDAAGIYFTTPKGIEE